MGKVSGIVAKDSSVKENECSGESPPGSHLGGHGFSQTVIFPIANSCVKKLLT